MKMTIGRASTLDAAYRSAGQAVMESSLYT